jgi:hypothetical protein
MVYRMLSLFLVAVALAVFVGAPAVAQEQQKQAAQGQAQERGDTHEGTVVSAVGNKLIMREKGQAQEHTHMLAPNAKVSIDGRDAKLEDLKPGLRIRVTTKKGDKTTALKVEALDRNKEFEKLPGTAK